MRRLRKAKKEAAPMEKPDVVKTHLRNMIILPEMIGSMVGVYNGKTFNQVEIKVGVTFFFTQWLCNELRMVLDPYTDLYLLFIRDLIAARRGRPPISVLRSKFGGYNSLIGLSLLLEESSYIEVNK